jgi:type IV secretion system protein TrbL
MACTQWQVIDPRCQIKQAAADAFEKMARSFASSAADASNWLWKQIDQATTINLTSPGITKDLVATGAIALVLCAGLFVIQVITSVLRREPSGLARAVKGLGVATVMSAFAIMTTKILLGVVDQLADGVVRFSTGTGIDGLGTRFALAASLAQLSNPAGLLLFAIVVLVAVVIVWVAMMMRKLLVIVAAVMTPIAFAGGAADITRSWVRRWIEFTAALIASKLLLVIMLMIGLSVFEGAGMQTGPDGHPAATQAGTQLATGAVLLLMAGFAPWLAIKMFHFAGESLHAVHAQAAAASAGTHSVVAAPRKVSNTMATGRMMSASASHAGASRSESRPPAALPMEANLGGGSSLASPPEPPSTSAAAISSGTSPSPPPSGQPEPASSPTAPDSAPDGAPQAAAKTPTRNL